MSRVSESASSLYFGRPIPTVLSPSAQAQHRPTLYSPKVEAEIELPCARLWTIAILVRQCNTQLDDLEHVDITSHGLVMIVGAGFERANGSSYNAGELGVLLGVSPPPPTLSPCC